MSAVPGDYYAEPPDVGPPRYDNMTGIGIVIAKYDFEGEKEEDLPLKDGQQARLLFYFNEEWLMCRSEETSAEGMVPAVFVDIYHDDELEDANQAPEWFAAPQNPTTTWEPNWDQSQPVVPAAPAAHPWGVPTAPPPPLPPATRAADEWKPAFPTTTTTSSTTGVADFSSWEPSWSLTSPSAEWWTTPAARAPPPPRPPPPQQHQQQPIMKSAEMGSTPSDLRRRHVIHELVASEKAFEKDMNAFAVSTSSHLRQTTRDTVTRAVMPIVRLSRIFGQELENRASLPADRQAFGELFISFKVGFSHTYSFFLRNLDAIHAAVEDESESAAWQAVVEKQRELHPSTSCIDMSSSVARPVQRCLKYPLLLAELVKETPLTDPDHPKLLEARRQMNNLAMKMNESRRRRELVCKYEGDKSEKRTLRQKLNSVSMHSFVKKSNRFKKRLADLFGIHAWRDVEFDSSLAELVRLEKLAVSFNFYVNRYIHSLETSINLKCTKLLSVTEDASIKKRVEEAAGQARSLASTTKQLLQSTVSQALLGELRAIPRKVVMKRQDKLYDWLTVKETLTDQSQANVHPAYREFQALNLQAKQRMAKSIGNLHNGLLDAWMRVENSHTTLQCEVASILRPAVLAIYQEKMADDFLATLFHAHEPLLRLQSLVAKVQAKAPEVDLLTATGIEMGVDAAAAFAVTEGKKKRKQQQLPPRAASKTRSDAASGGGGGETGRKPHALSDRNVRVVAVPASAQPQPSLLDEDIPSGGCLLPALQPLSVLRRASSQPQLNSAASSQGQQIDPNLLPELLAPWPGQPLQPSTTGGFSHAPPTLMSQAPPTMTSLATPPLMSLATPPLIPSPIPLVPTATSMPVRSAPLPPPPAPASSSQPLVLSPANPFAELARHECQEHQTPLHLEFNQRLQVTSSPSGLASTARRSSEVTNNSGWVQF